MPIYEYQCGACGQVQEFLQKVSEAPRTRCAHCGQEALTKRVTAAGFQLKGSGWYVTDFRNGANKSDTKPGGSGKPAEGSEAAGQKSESGKPASSEGAAASSPSAGATTTAAPASSANSSPGA